MIEFPDDELDKLFRKSSEELDPQFDPEDWNSLKKRLDEHDGRTPAAWFRKWWPLGLLLLLIPVGIASYMGQSDRKVQPKVDRAERGLAEEKKSAEEKSEIRTQSKNGTERETQALQNNIENKGAAKNEIGLESAPAATVKIDKRSKTTLPRSLSKAGGVYLEPNRSNGEGGEGAFYSNKKEEKVAVERINKQTLNNELGAGPAVAQAQQEEQSEEDKKTLVPASMLASRSMVWEWPDSLPSVIAPEMETAAEPAIEEDSKDSDFGKWAVRFGYSPDLSTIGMKDFVKPGTAVSLLAEYAVIPRLYFQSGVIWSSKRYYGEGKSYQISFGDHYYGPDVKSVDGECKVLEIPLNLRYDLLRGRRSLFFIGGGISSYHMNSEKYHYKYENESDPKIKYRDWSTSTGWYWLSHVNASAGYEYRFSRKLSLLAEPYVRIPVKKVGYGKVNLFTTGLWLSVRYAPNFK